MFETHCRKISNSADRNRWLKERAGYLGASDAAGILGLSKWSSPYSIYHSRVHGLEAEETERMEWGLRLERAILDGANERIEAVDGRVILPCGDLMVSTELPWAGATLDGVASDGSLWWPVEAKTVDTFAASDWDDGAPIHYVCQCQWQMMVTGAHKCTIVALIGGNRLVWQDIPRDQAMIDRLMVEGALLWDRIQRQDPPPVDGHEATTRALNQLAPDGSEVELGDEAEDLTQLISDAELRRKAIKEELDAVEDRIALHKNKLRLLMGEAAIGRLADGRFWQWKIETRAAHMVAASESRVMRLKAAKKGRRAA